ncbi:MAG: phosphoribosyl-AMP cyclohydrolase, partial [Burkholderiaceae bacterium]|nr:phosphoribosyl-AMP cyclohydrolase [Burkholderiaceae bacterium]
MTNSKFTKTSSLEPGPWLDRIVWNEQGLVPVIAQEASSGDVLMMAWMNQVSLMQ